LKKKVRFSHNSIYKKNLAKKIEWCDIFEQEFISYRLKLVGINFRSKTGKSRVKVIYPFWPLIICISFEMTQIITVPTVHLHIHRIVEKI
jgi:hypothetical protein